MPKKDGLTRPAAGTPTGARRPPNVALAAAGGDSPSPRQRMRWGHEHGGPSLAGQSSPRDDAPSGFMSSHVSAPAGPRFNEPCMRHRRRCEVRDDGSPRTFGTGCPCFLHMPEPWKAAEAEAARVGEREKQARAAAEQRIDGLQRGAEIELRGAAEKVCSMKEEVSALTEALRRTELERQQLAEEKSTWEVKAADEEQFRLFMAQEEMRVAALAESKRVAKHDAEHGAAIKLLQTQFTAAQTRSARLSTEGEQAAARLQVEQQAHKETASEGAEKLVAAEAAVEAASHVGELQKQAAAAANTALTKIQTRQANRKASSLSQISRRLSTRVSTQFPPPIAFQECL